MDQRDVVVVAEHGHDLFGLIVPQQARVDEDAGQLVADGLVDQHGGHRGVHPAGEAADHLALAHLLADALDHLLAERLHGPVALQARDLVGEVAQDQRAAWRVSDLGMELDAVEAPPLIGDHREGGALGGGHHMKALRDGGDLVPVAHPDGFLGADAAQAVQQRAFPLDQDLGAAELPMMAALHRAA